ncbi:hypothetical protein M0804_009411 [Polistes exclamans]|nr:hypothetical protein M0804_009411 [Polistes exclamans]
MVGVLQQQQQQQYTAKTKHRFPNSSTWHSSIICESAGVFHCYDECQQFCEYVLPTYLSKLYYQREREKVTFVRTLANL